ncbi:MAG: discoidin domain-containing protein [Ignavibacteriaceae bacterium]|nr:discoidin domain-containing protein [Ignavibacteriaceae bacterium]
MKKIIYLSIFIAFLAQTLANSATNIIEKFENLSDLKEIASDGAKIKLSIENLENGNCLKLEYEFSGAGYCGIEKVFPFQLPTNYKFSFSIKGHSPKNNLEFKLVDKTGDNVWWRNQRNFDFPIIWEKINIKKRDIEFAWGPVGGGEVKNFERIQIIIAAAEGGKGTIYIDDLVFEEIVPPLNPEALPTINSSESKDKNLNNLIDGNLKTVWQNKTKSDKQSLTIDLQYMKELGGMVIHWGESKQASSFSVAVSNDRVNWEKVYSIANNWLTRNFIYMKDIDARYVKISLEKSNDKNGYTIKEIEIKDPKFSQNLNDFFTNVASYYKEGLFPKYFSNKQSYWTIIGVSEDPKEAMINEQGAIEIDKSSFSIEPFIQIDNKLITWSDVKLSQHLEKEYIPIPSVQWQSQKINLEIKALAFGEPNKSDLLVKYTLTNTTKKVLAGKFLLAIRPYQVNPKWQFLNNEGGISKIKEISYDNYLIKINKNKVVVPLTQPDDFGVTKFSEGEIIDYLSKNVFPQNQTVEDKFGFASGCMSYNLTLGPGKTEEYIIKIPFHDSDIKPILESAQQPSKFFAKNLADQIAFWEEKLDKIKINLPSIGDKVIKTMRTYLGYILINKDGPSIQPGSRSYERSWIRDGALTSSALLRLGLKDEVRTYLEWFSQYQFPTGKIPCVVDKRGADPTPENDSHGQYIFALLQYFKFTKDTLFLKEKLQNVIGAVNYIEFLTNQRKTDQYKKPDSTVFWGLMPESISHEGYSAKPMHSYWDDFFTIRGLRDAVEIALILNEKELAHRFEKLRDEFGTDLLNSINLAIKNHNIDYIPGCAELGDFDATSTTIALFPCNEQKLLPQKELINTFEKYYQFCLNRISSKADWINYTPYELRTVGSFVYLNQRDRAHKLLDFFFDDQRPSAWNHWAEVVWKNIDEPRFIGDMPHTWVGSDYINSIRSMFVYEDDLDSSLVLGAGLKMEWIDSDEGVIVANLPTYYGSLSYSIKKELGAYIVSVSGDIKFPRNNIVFKNFKKEKPSKVFVDGIEYSNYNTDEIVIDHTPSTLRIEY